MIETIAKSNEAERKALFTEAASDLKMSPEMVEKDFWVCWTLNRIFSNESLKKILCFKGGTSLSKVFHLIERFSEDIDLILDWNTISKGVEVIKEDRSRSKQNKLNETLLEESKIFISTILKEKIEGAVGDICAVEVDADDGNNLFIRYPKGISGKYLLPYIKLEIGPLAAWMPNDVYSIKPYISDMESPLKFKNIFVPTIKAERTFWEKATILHAEHFRTKETPERYSRHYYDLYKMAKSEVKQHAFDNLDLLDEVVRFKQRFYYAAWANYQEATPGTFHLLPKEANIKALQADYKKMKEMIFGEYPDFEEIISVLAALETEINDLAKS